MTPRRNRPSRPTWLATSALPSFVAVAVVLGAALTARADTPDGATDAAAVSTGSSAVAAVARVSGAGSGRGGIAVWESSLAGEHGVSPDVTVRQLARLSVPVDAVSVRLGNPFGDRAVVVRNAWLGRPAVPGGAELVPGSNRPLTFHGARQVTIAPGREVLSDPVTLRTTSPQEVAVSVYAPDAPVNDHAFPPFSLHPPAMYVGTGGDHAADPSAATFPSMPVITGETTSTATGYHPGQLWWMDLVVARRAEAAGTVVTLGDSITDGYHAEGPPGQRWSDVLADRMNAVPARQRYAVANAGISGNTVSVQPNPYDATGECCGPPAPVRLDRDVLSVPGVRTVFLLEGTNDLGGGDNAPPAPASQVIQAMKGLADRVHAKHLRIVGATVLPMCNAAGSDKENARLAVNDWIRTSRAFDAVVDFDALLRDPADPTVMRGDLRYDCYHPNAAGDAVLGNAIPLRVVTG